MKKIFLLFSIGLIFGLCGCDLEKPKKPHPDHMEVICIDGVEYIQLFVSQLAPHFRPDGTLYTCE